jgi:AraC family transcriptional regulator
MRQPFSLYITIVIGTSNKNNMLDKITEKDYQARINNVIDYILKNLNNDVSLQALSDIANYSPFHLQKIFRRVVGQTPKQYIIQLRLETALHHLVIHPHKSITEVSIDCGFSSPAVFSRAITNFFGISPIQMRLLPHNEKIKIFKNKNSQFVAPPSEIPNSLREFKIEIKKMDSISGIYCLAPFDNVAAIQKSFKEIMKFAAANDIAFSQENVYGILSPHQCNIYKAFISVSKEHKLPNKCNVTKIKAGKYASFKVIGDKTETLKAAHFFFHKWLPESGYRIADIVGFEKFTENPASGPYDFLPREFFIPIEPV